MAGPGRSAAGAVRHPFGYTKIRAIDSFMQWFHGRRDGRRSIPNVAPADQPVAVTPHDRSLIARCVEVTERERQLLFERSETTCREIAECLEQIAHTEAEIVVRRAAVEAANGPPELEALRVRGVGEAEFTEAVVVHRRRAEHARSVAPVHAALDRAEQALVDLRKSLAGLEAAATTDVQKAQSRGAQYCSYVEGLRTRYWRALLRAYPEPADLVGRVPPAWVKPEWIGAADYRQVLGLRIPSASDGSPITSLELGDSEHHLDSFG